MSAQSKEPAPNDFAALFEASMKKLVAGFDPGALVRGTVTDIGEDAVFIDVGAKSEGVIDRHELTDASGALTVQPGQEIEAYFVGSEAGELRFTTRISGAAAERLLREAYQGGIPVEGAVTEERKGGFTVMIGGQQAFCPYSQIDLPGGAPASEQLGQHLSFVITQFDPPNLVVSRRRLLERERAAERAKLEQTLKVGDIVSGVVRRVQPFGAFVDIGGVEGLVPVGELAWDRVESAESVIRAGEAVQVAVTGLDWAAGRISLSLRRAGADPWTEAEERYPVGSRHAARVTRLIPAGAICRLEAGVEGLIHISKLGGGRRIGHAQEVMAVGDEVEVVVESFDAKARRVSLAPADYADAEASVAELRPGDVTRGVVDSIKEFGLFVRLGGRRTGLVHISRLPLEDEANKVRAMNRQYPVGTVLDVEVVEVDAEANRISLRIPAAAGETGETAAAEEDAAPRAPRPDPRAFGSLADFF